MGAFKEWLRLQELSLGSDGIRDNAPTQTNNTTKAVASKWMSNPQNSDFTSNLVTLGQQHPSALNKPLMDAGAQAIKAAGTVGNQTTAPAVAQFMQTSLKLPQVLPPPKPGAVKMMRRRMRRV